MTVLLAAVPFGMQGLVTVADEFYFHRRRGLPRWERIPNALLEYFMDKVATRPINNQLYDRLGECWYGANVVQSVLSHACHRSRSARFSLQGHELDAARVHRLCRAALMGVTMGPSPACRENLSGGWTIFRTTLLWHAQFVRSLWRYSQVRG